MRVACFGKAVEWSMMSNDDDCVDRFLKENAAGFMEIFESVNDNDSHSDEVK